MMQDNITRMAGNSANCKTWLVTLVTGLLAIGASLDEMNGWIFLSIIPVIGFWALDAYYLTLERGMRNRQRLFIIIINANSFVENEYKQALFNFKPFKTPKDDIQTGLVSTRSVAWSKSVCPFYLAALFIALTVSIIVLLNH